MDFTVITEKRNALGMSVAELCRKAGLSRKTYYKLANDPEHGYFSTISKLVNVLALTDEEKIRLLT